MTLPVLLLDQTGNTEVVDAQRFSYNAMTNVPIASASQPYICAGSGAPTFTAPQGTLYLRTDGSSTSTRLYVNTTGSTTWTNFTSAA